MEQRGIKFRVWNTKWDTMIYKSEGKGYDPVIHLDGSVTGTMISQNTFKWMQYTGLKDKNGKEIYEGDIIRNSGYPELCIVEFIEGQWIGRYYPQSITITKDQRDKSHYIGLSFYVTERNSIEVLGNIYENPELL